MKALIPAPWRPGPRYRPLAKKNVHVWRASLDPPEERLARLAETLSHEEEERAARFATDGLRNRYVAARGILRTLLATYLESAPGDIQFRYGEHGKPYLTGDDLAAALQFNVSHSRDLALFGIALGREIGVDLEWTGRSLEQSEIASRFFSGAESKRLQELSPEDQIPYFFALWTCKEAFVKAKGEGVSFGLDRFDVQLEPEAQGAEIVSNRQGEAFSPWFAFRLEPGHGFAGALAVDIPNPEISLWDWPSVGGGLKGPLCTDS